MIKRIKYNGMYVTFISFLFTVALSTYQHYFRTDVKYYFEVLKLGVPANFNMTTIKYCLRTFSFKQNFKLIFGFDQINLNHQ